MAGTLRINEIGVQVSLVLTGYVEEAFKRQLRTSTLDASSQAVMLNSTLALIVNFNPF
jgi:hypothetical protein